jgi:hypothetical protein
MPNFSLVRDPDAPDPQLPRVCELMSPATQALIDGRPTAIKAAYTGRYADILRGWEAQAARFRRYLAEECAAARLPTATAQALLELAGSEFWATLDLSAQTAIGEVKLFRGAGTFPTGTIRKGHRFARTADPTAKPPVLAAQFVSTAPVYVAQGQQSVVVPIEAVGTGTDPNTPLFDFAVYSGSSVDTLFDSNLFIQSVVAAGGSKGIDDVWGRLVAMSSYAGQFGPNTAALIAGVFEVPRARRAFHVLDSANAVSKVFVADASWGCSDLLQSRVKQVIKDKWLGWGAKVSVFPIINKLVNVVANVTLVGPQYLDDTSDILDKIRTALKTHFDEKPDFYTFKLRALRGLISQCDSRILQCTSVAVLDSSGSPISEPAALSGSAQSVTHFYLNDDAISIAFSIPS